MGNKKTVKALYIRLDIYRIPSSLQNAGTIHKELRSEGSGVVCAFPPVEEQTLFT